MEVTWAKVIVFAGTSGILSALVVHLLGLFDQWRKHGRDAGYLAIRIATALEAYADECLTIIAEFDLHQQFDGAAGSQTLKLPAVPEFPEDVDGWRSMPPRLTAEVLAFPNHVKAGQDRVRFTWSVAGELGAWDDCQDECARLGFRAWEIAAALRKAYQFPDFKPRFDVGSALKRHINPSHDATD